MFQDLHIFDVHSHFPVKDGLGGIGGGKLRTRETGPIENPAVAERQEQQGQALERMRHNWRLAFDFPEPEKEMQPAEVQAERWIAELDKYGKWNMNLLTIRPGLTGLWQVSGRSELGYEDRVRLDMTYIRNYSIWLDLQILLRTIPAVMYGRGAY